MKRFLSLLLMLMLLLPCAAPAEDTDTTLRYGDQGDAVVSVQSRLQELGYFTGKLTGRYLDATKKAVLRFQKEYGLPETGEVDKETNELLQSAEYRVLQSGSNGADVTRLQERLKELGYFANQKLTDKFRAVTEKAVKAFQEHNGLEATGIADLDTQRLLFSDAALAKGVSAVPTAPPDGDLGDIDDMVIAGDGENIDPYENKLTRGAKGENVKKVQTRLKELGFFDGPISGNYMNQTMAAVEAFQTHNGMRATGLTDEATWNMLFNSADVLTSGDAPRPTPEPTPIPYAVTVDVNNQAVIVYGPDANGEYTVPVRRMICSTGTKATPSDVGVWTLDGRRARWCYFPTWKSHAQYWTRITPSIAFHSVIYNSVNTSALSTKSYNKLGQRASHGCIRLLVSDARWIYENLGEGIQVTITEDLPRDDELRHAVAAPPLNKAKTGPVSTPQPTPEPEYKSDAMPPQPFEKLKKRDENEAVYWLQCKLHELGYYNGAITGGYYSGTEKAVKAFQKDHHISATGTADVRTLEAIYADVIAAQTAEPEPSADPTAEPTFTPSPTPSPTPAP